MATFVFDKDIFQKKFIMGNIFKNRAKNTAPGCDSICPNDSNTGTAYKGYTSTELLADVIHNIQNKVVTDKKIDDLDAKIIQELEKQVAFDNDDLRKVFKDVIASFYFENNRSKETDSFSLLCFSPASKEKDFGKFVVDVFLDAETRECFRGVLNQETSPLDIIVGNSYSSLNLLKPLPAEQEYSRVFSEELKSLFDLLNNDVNSAVKISNNSIKIVEFVLAYYLFTYLSQLALRLDSDLFDKKNENAIVYFKMAQETISEDRDCVVQGWKKIERKTSKIFKHLIVLNMLNCHDNSTNYLTYSQLYKEYSDNPEIRTCMDDSIDYIIHQYTKVYEHDTDSGSIVDFSGIEYPSENLDEVEKFKQKVIYLFNCVSHQLESKNYRQNVVTYVASNYNHILKMRFVKSWGQLGNMLMLSNEDLIYMIRICQLSSDSMDKQRGIRISDLFVEFEKRRLYFDGKTKQYIIEYLFSRNLIDSKCDSEEAQYVKPIQ